MVSEAGVARGDTTQGTKENHIFSKNEYITIFKNSVKFGPRGSGEASRGLGGVVPEAGGARGDNTQGTKEKHIFHQKMLKSIFLNISLNSSQGGLGGWSWRRK